MLCDMNLWLHGFVRVHVLVCNVLLCAEQVVLSRFVSVWEYARVGSYVCFACVL